jgi:MOSC domain-containing protein YiiM
LVVSADGVDGDFNRWRTEKANGDPDQAVLLHSVELLGELNAEGWPVKPGDLGENLTVAGLSGMLLVPGARVTSGDVILEISKPCDPCTILYSLPYVGAERGSEFVRTLKGRRGWFARVVKGGSVEIGFPIEVQPAAITAS